MAGVLALVAVMVLGAVRGFRAAARERLARAVPRPTTAPTVVIRDKSSDPKMHQTVVAFGSTVVAALARVRHVSSAGRHSSTLTQ
jgi:hypothetical protein